MRKTMRVLSLLALLALLIPACGAPATEAPAGAVVTEAPAGAVATEAPAAAEPVKLTIWWWGEQEAPGAQAWLDETMALYTAAHPNITFEAVLQATDTLLPAFQTAAAAKEGPDIQYFWPGVWTIENAWIDAIIPLDDLIPAEEWAHYLNVPDVQYDGKTWGVPWYLSGNPVVFNPDLFTKAGLDPKAPPATWDELLNACDKLRAVDVIPIAGGMKDGWFSGWLFSIVARQPHDSAKDFMKASVGQVSYTDPKFTEWWGRMKELKDRGCWNDDIGSLDYQQGQDLFVTEKAAMLFGNDTFLAGWAQIMGWDKIAVMLTPRYGDGQMADDYISASQGWGITSWSEHPQEAADFLVFMHTPERVDAFFKTVGVLPADDRLDTSLITQPVLQQVFEWDTTRGGANMENFIPTMMDEQANYVGVQLLFAGDTTPEELGQLTEDVNAKWREQNPDAVANFEKWAK